MPLQWHSFAASLSALNCDVHIVQLPGSLPALFGIALFISHIL